MDSYSFLGPVLRIRRSGLVDLQLFLVLPCAEIALRRLRALLSLSDWAKAGLRRAGSASFLSA